MHTNWPVKRYEFFACFLLFLLLAIPASSQSLTLSDVQTIIAQAVSKAVALNQKVTISVTDKEGNLLGTFQMTGAPANTLIKSVGRPGPFSLESIPVPSMARPARPPPPPSKRCWISA